MHLPKFEHQRPATLREAAQLLKEYGSRAQIAAGGTDLYPRMKYGLLRPEVLISLKGLSAESPVTVREGELHLDAFMSLADVVRSPEVLERTPLLAEAALNVASNQIRHMATLGGNLCLEPRCTYYNQSHTYQYVEPCFKRGGERCYLIPKGRKCQAVFMADTVPALICLDAKIEIQSYTKARQLAVADLYTGDPLSPFALSGGELVGRVIIPEAAANRGSGFTKFSLRGGMEFGAVNVAVVLDGTDEGRTCHNARITVGSVSSKPVRAVKAEKALNGKKTSEALLREVAKKIATEVRPVMHHGYSVPFLRACLEVQAYRTLARAVEKMSMK
ncbi:MAG: FAD binding domain-containing protein [Desulfobacteraceae bacterium]|jgi:4-hydroxybenzoyl-CoA reductase beta subunit